MKSLYRFLALLLFVATASAARADLFNFNFAGGGQNASGTLNANATGNSGQFLITSINGTLTGVSISGLIAPGGYNGNDNILNASGGSFIPDGAGFSFLLSNGIRANIFTFTTPPFAGQQFLTRSDGTSAFMTTFSITPAPVPEPSSLVLLGSGALGLLPTLRRKFMRSA